MHEDLQKPAMCTCKSTVILELTVCKANHPTVPQWQPLHPDIEWLLHHVGRGSCSTIRVCTRGWWISFQGMSYICKSAIICSKLLPNKVDS